ncbi:MAG: enoyl-CoA hydratase/isomerase family protein [Halobacteriaceae archaeon]
MIGVDPGEAITTVTLDRPDRRNALDHDALVDLRTAIETVTSPVTYLHGAGTAFCAGADLDMVRGVAADPGAAHELAAVGQRTMDAIEDADTIVVAGIDGAARGGGVELAVACDLRVATPTATFAEPGVDLGIFGAGGGTRRLPDLLGRGRALDLAVTGRTIDADTAERWGLVTTVTDTPRTVAETVAAGDPDAVRALKGLLRTDRDRAATNAAEASAFAALASAGSIDR